MKAVIMAGGQGTRLRPLTCNMPKPMMPIVNRPIMEHIIEILKENGIDDIVVTLRYLSDEIIQYFEDGSRFGVKIKYFIEEVPLGTAGSVKNAEEFLDDTFIVISGDALIDINLTKAIEYHIKKKAVGTLILKQVLVPLEYGVVITDKEGRITDFLEKPSWSEVFSDKANTGIYILEPKIFSYYEKGEKFDFSKDLFPILINNNEPLFGYITDEYWCDIGSVEQYHKCNFDMLRGDINIKIKEKKCKENICIEENCEISPKVKIIPPVFIGKNTKIYNNAQIGPYTVIGENNIISSDATIKRSILFNNCYIGNNCEIRGSILCKNVQLQSKVSIFEDTTIGEDTLIESKVIIKPGVKIWSSKIIESSSVVRSNVIWAGNFSKSIFGKNSISGGVNIDITPEFVSKLGSAYGSLLKPGTKVIISCNNHGAAQMFKHSLATGLLSMGIDVYDLNVMTTIMTRYSVSFLGVSGAIHIIVDKEDTEKANILFMDDMGLDIDKNMKRKIESSFNREDFRRVKADSIKKISEFPNIIENYIRSIIKRLEVKKICAKGYKIVLNGTNTVFIDIMQKILSEINVDFKIYTKAKDLIGLTKEVVKSNANLGIYISSEGNEAILVDEFGKIIKDDYYEALKYFVILKSSKINTLVVPVTSSKIMEYVANKCGAKFIRTKTSHRNILESYVDFEKDLELKYIVRNYLLSMDPIGIVLFTINLMAVSNISLSNIVAKFPKYYKKKKDVICPWNMKGMVMRKLIEENHCNSMELIEGVSINYGTTHVLVIPDAGEPLCKIYIESQNKDEGEFISDEIINKIEKLVEKNNYI